MVEANPLLDLTDPSIGQVRSMVRFDVVNELGNAIGHLKPLQAGNVQANTSGNIKRTLDSILVLNSELADVDIYRDRLAPYWVLEDGTEWPLGKYVFTGAQVRPGTYASTTELQLYDGDFILDQNTKETMSVSPGTLVTTALNMVADQALIIDRSIETNITVVKDPINWPAGTSRKTIMQDLCKLAGLYPPYFNNVGRMIVESPPNLDETLPDHVYAPENSRILRATIVENDNLLTAPNVHLVVASGPTSGEIVAYSAVNPALPWSSARRGFEIVEVHRQQGVADTKQAEEMARNFAQVTADGYLIVEFDAFPDPRHDLFQIVEWAGSNYRETSWTLPLTPGGPHKHTLTRAGFTDAG